MKNSKFTAFNGVIMMSLLSFAHGEPNDDKGDEEKKEEQLISTKYNTVELGRFNRLRAYLSELSHVLNKEWLGIVVQGLTNLNQNDVLMGYNRSEQADGALQMAYNLLLKNIFKELKVLLKDPSKLFENHPHADFFIRHMEYLNRIMYYFEFVFEKNGSIEGSEQDISEMTANILQLFYFIHADDNYFNSDLEANYAINHLFIEFEEQLVLITGGNRNKKFIERLGENFEFQAFIRSYLLYIRIQIYLRSYKAYIEHLQCQLEIVKAKVNSFNERFKCIRINADDIEYTQLFESYRGLLLKMNRLDSLIQNLTKQEGEYRQLLEDLLEKYNQSLMHFSDQFKVLGLLRPWLELRKILALLTYQILEGLPQAFSDELAIVNIFTLANQTNPTVHMPLQLTEGRLGMLLHEGDLAAHLHNHNPDHGSPLLRYVLERDIRGIKYENL